MKTVALVLAIVSIVGWFYSLPWRPQFSFLLGLAFILGAMEVFREGVITLPSLFGPPRVWKGWIARAWGVLFALCSLAIWNAVLMAWGVGHVSERWTGFELALCSAVVALFLGLLGLALFAQLPAAGVSRVVSFAAVGSGLGIIGFVSVVGLLIGSYIWLTGRLP
jgi:hypothetical protein